MAKGRDAALQQIRKFHQATIIPTPNLEPVKRAVSKAVPGRVMGADVLPPQPKPKGHYDSFRPHPLLTKRQQETRQPAEPRTVAPPKPSAPPPRQLKPDAVPTRHPQRPQVLPEPSRGTLTTPQPRPAPERPYAQPGAPVQPKQRHKVFDFIQYPLIAAGALGASLSTSVGQILIGIFFIVAIITKLPSKVAFVGSLLLLICIPFFQVLNLSGTSQNAAVYAFEMLVVGTFLAIIELWKDGRSDRSRVERHA
jgi:hypothetical protein